MSIQSRIGSIRIFGYLLKVVHDVVMLPQMRQDILNEIKSLELRSTPRREFSGEIVAVEQRLSNEIYALEVRSVALREFNNAIDAIEQRLAAISRAAESLSDHPCDSVGDRNGGKAQEGRMLEQHVEALAASARRAKREQSELGRELADACSRISALEADAAGILQVLRTGVHVEPDIDAEERQPSKKTAR